MFLRAFSILILFLLTNHIFAQDIVIHSKKSDEAVQQLKELVSSIEDNDLLKSFSDKEIKILTAASSALDGKTYPVPENFKAKGNEIIANLVEKMRTAAKEIGDENRKETVMKLIGETEAQLVKDLKDHGLKAMAEIIKGVSDLQKESDANNKSLNDLLKAEPKDVDKMTQTLLNAWQKSNEEAIIKASGQPITDIKKTAEVNLTKEAEKVYPMPTDATLEADAEKEFPRIVKGQKISITWFPRPNQAKVSKGTIMVVTNDYVVFDNRDKVLIRDIKDPKIKDGLSENKTKANRAEYIKNKKTDVLKSRSRHFVKNLQDTVNKIIADNEKKGFIIAEGEWQPAAKYVSAGISKRLKDWKKAKAGMLDKAILLDNKLINDLDGQKDAYTSQIKALTEEGKLELAKHTDSMIAGSSVDKTANIDNEDVLAKLEAEANAKKAALAADAAAVAAENRKIAAQKAAAKKAAEKKAAEEAAARSKSRMIMIAVVLLLIGGAAFVFFNPKVRSKVLGGGKKKSMSDVVATLQAPGGAPGSDELPPLPMPGASAAPPGVPTGMAAPRDGGATQVTEKTQIELDPGLNIERGGVEEAPSAAPRKKISLNLGGSSTPLADPSTDESNADTNSGGGLTPPGGGLTPPGGGLTPPGGGLTPPGGGLTPPGGGLTPPGGGLTPPGGGLTPPGGGLTPPGGGESEKEEDPPEEDKSNLILNPNMDGGSKLRLKK